MDVQDSEEVYYSPRQGMSYDEDYGSQSNTSVLTSADSTEASGISGRRRPMLQQSAATVDDYDYSYGYGATTADTTAATSAPATTTTAASTLPTTSSSVPATPAHAAVDKKDGLASRSASVDHAQSESQDYYQGYDGYGGYEGYDGYGYNEDYNYAYQSQDQLQSDQTVAGAGAATWGGANSYYYSCQDEDYYAEQDASGPASLEPRPEATVPVSASGPASVATSAPASVPTSVPASVPASGPAPESASGAGAKAAGLGSALGFGSALGTGLGTATLGGIGGIGSPSGIPSSTPSSPMTSQAERDAERDAMSSMPQQDMQGMQEDETQASLARKRQFQQRGSRTRGLDSLESRDDDLRESFETAISSVSHTFPTPSSTAPTEAYHPEDMPPSLVGPAVPSRRHGTATTAITTTATSASIATSLASTALPSTSSGMAADQRYLRSQDSVESYGDEVWVFAQGMEYSGYDDRYDHTQGSLDRGESILEEDEEYAESPVPKPQDAAASTPPPTLQPGMGSLEEEVPPEAARSPDLIRKSSLELEVETPKKLETVVGQPTQTQPQRPKMNARERWHWAYNRVVHQINVSTRLPADPPQAPQAPQARGLCPATPGSARLCRRIPNAASLSHVSVGRRPYSHSTPTPRAAAPPRRRAGSIQLPAVILLRPSPPPPSLFQSFYFYSISLALPASPHPFNPQPLYEPPAVTP
ncbi:hypothetical protein ONE63_002370 [Megalurothrips usitatus]|uniref:Uncharacterized protein n=1 Tax=Megalurothrips usitatus TaxID=439358 RepID=A0AAV7X7Y3_9NEOP|nr:hypothetical protein ONE63_002370 [Megalurothrips usitatus]